MNLDQGIEYAYELLRGTRSLPPPYIATHGLVLEQWRSIAAVNDAPELRVVRSDDEFTRWVADGAPAPVLLKLHGSLDYGRELIEPIVEEDPELGGLSAIRLATLDALTDRPGVLITGYAGHDIDIYEPLLERLSDRKCSVAWACPTSRIPK